MIRYEISGAMVTSIHGDPVELVQLGEEDSKVVPGRMWFVVTTAMGAEIEVACKPDNLPEIGAQVTVALEVEDA